MLQRGGVGFLGATKVAYGRPGWDEPSDGQDMSLLARHSGRHERVQVDAADRIDGIDGRQAAGP